jgi:putative addiction module antidote
MIGLKIQKFGNSIGVILPTEILSRLQIDEGDYIYLTESIEGYSLFGFDADFAETMKAFEDTYAQYHNAFKELAQ